MDIQEKIRMDPFTDRVLINCDIEVDTSSLKGKTAIVTGGASGIGEVYARALSGAGVSVCIGDVDEIRGQELAKGLENATFVKCDVTKWADQLQMFKTALAKSPNGGIDIVVANAGIAGRDDIFFTEEDQEDPSEPQMNITKINHVGVLYTIKLALHYFRRQFKTDQNRASFLILQSSLAGYLELAGTPQYNGAKFGLRGMMRSLRRTSLQHGTRINLIGPWYIATNIMGDDAKKMIQDSGAGFAEVEDCGSCLLQIVTDSSIHGRSFAIVPRRLSSSGYRDMDGDDYVKEHWLREMQVLALAPAHRVEKVSVDG